MRFFLRRLAFYAFAVWVALTLNFLLPRLMPGDPIGGVLQRLSPSQIQSNPGIIKTYEALLGGGHHSIWHDYVIYLHRVAHLNFGVSTSNYPAHVSEVIGRVLPYSIFLVGVAFVLAFLLGTGIGMVAAWRRGGGFDTIVVPVFMALSAFPAFFTGLVGVYFLGLKLHWFPIQHAYDSGLVPGFNWAFLTSALRHSELPILVIVAAFTRRLGAEHAHGDDQHDRRGLRGDGAREGPARPPCDDAVRRPKRDPAAAERLRRAVRERGRRPRLHRVRLQLPGRGLTLQQAALGNDYPLTQGLLVVFALCVIAANFVMDLLNLVLDPRVRTG